MLKNKKTFLIIIALCALMLFSACRQSSSEISTPTPYITAVVSEQVMDEVTPEPVAETPTPEPEPSDDTTLAPTSAPETNVYIPINQDILNLVLGMRYTDAEILAGKYNDMNIEDARDAIGSYLNICTYNFGSIGYVQYDQTPVADSWIYYILVDKPGYIGPQGIQVGDSLNNAIEKLGIPSENFSQEYSEIYADGSILGYVYLNDPQTESWQISLYYGDNELRTFFINVEESKVISFGAAEQLN